MRILDEARGLRVAVLLGLIALGLALSYIVRTQPFLGTFVHDRIVSEASGRGVDLEIQTVEPHGFAGLRLVSVAARIPIRGRGYAVEVDAARVEFVPSLSGLLSGQLRIRDVVVRDGALALVPMHEVPEPKQGSHRKASNRSKEVGAKADVSTKDTPSHAPRLSRRALFEDGVSLVLHDIHVFVDTRIKTRRAFKLKRASVDFSKELRPLEMSGYGALPDRTTFALSTDDSSGVPHFRVVPETATRLDDWVDVESGVELYVGAFDACLECESVFAVEDVRVAVPSWSRQLALVTPSAALSRSSGRLGLSSSEIEIEDRSQHRFAARVTDSDLTYDLDQGALKGTLGLAEPTGGTATLRWNVAAQTADLAVFFDGFDTASVWEALDFESWVEPGVVDGSLELEWHRAMGLVELEVSTRMRALSVERRRLSSTPLTFDRVGFRSHLLIDLPGSVVSLSKGSVRLGAASPIEFEGRILSAGAGAFFEFGVSGRELHALTIRDGLPESIGEVAQGAIIDGAFDFDLKVSGHTLRPESLVLDGSLGGDVQVLKDGPGADIRSLASAGPPPNLDRVDLTWWRSYDELPPIVSHVMLSAEDAAFFGHPGFDWPGLRAAMVHNLENRALERGGSTISQQVVKNLYLDPDRTVARKLQEAYLTWRLESEVSKQRILEIYLNIVEWGGATYGIERAARRYFEAAASELGVVELAMLASILPNPARFGGAIRKGRLPSSRMNKIVRVLKNLSFLGHISVSDFRRHSEAVERGTIGRLELEICDDDGSVEAGPCW